MLANFACFLYRFVFQKICVQVFFFIDYCCSHFCVWSLFCCAVISFLSSFFKSSHWEREGWLIDFYCLHMALGLSVVYDFSISQSYEIAFGLVLLHSLCYVNLFVCFVLMLINIPDNHSSVTLGPILDQNRFKNRLKGLTHCHSLFCLQ